MFLVAAAAISEPITHRCSDVRGMERNSKFWAVMKLEGKSAAGIPIFAVDLTPGVERNEDGLKPI